MLFFFYISNSSSTFYTFHKFQINSRMNNRYDQRYISIDILLKENHKFYLCIFKGFPKLTVTFSIGQSYKIQSKSMRANLQIGSKENMFVNVLEIFNDVFVQIIFYQIEKWIISI